MNLKQEIENRFHEKVALTQVKNKNGDKYLRITWVAHWRAWTAYHLLFPGQTCERLEERGGFGEYELDAFYPEWRNYIVE